MKDKQLLWQALFCYILSTCFGIWSLVSLFTGTLPDFEILLAFAFVILGNQYDIQYMIKTR